MWCGYWSFECGSVKLILVIDQSCLMAVKFLGDTEIQWETKNVKLFLVEGYETLSLYVHLESCVNIVAYGELFRLLATQGLKK